MAERGFALVLGSALVATATYATLSFIEMDSAVGLGVMVASVLAVVAVAVPVHWLPAGALLVYVVVPNKLIPDIALLTTVPLGTMLLIAWRLRVSLDRASRRFDTSSTPGSADGSLLAARVFAGIFALWAVLSAVMHTSQLFGLGWLLSIVASLFIGLSVRSAVKEALLLRKAWILVGAAAGLYAVVEFALGYSPLFGTLYGLVGAEDSQHWSVYRAEVSFSHPLFAGAFFAVATSLALVRWFEVGRARILVCAICSGAGLVASVSRGPLIAAVVAIVLGVLLLNARRGGRISGRNLLFVALAIAAVLMVSQVDAFEERATSVEAGRSFEARDIGIEVGLQAAQSSNYLGTGPATSGQTAAQFGTVVIENSYLQILISLGIPGLLLLVLLLGTIAFRALRTRRYSSLAALVAIGIALAGFNALDAVRSMHLVLGLAVFLAVHTPTEDPTGIGSGEALLRPKAAQSRRERAGQSLITRRASRK